MDWKLEPPRIQTELPSEPYDRWVSPGGFAQAEFHRQDQGFLIRFPGQADFELKQHDQSQTYLVTGWPTPECDQSTMANLHHNAIQPILGNHSGGLFLHGSAVRITDDTGAIAILGLSRGGKTTLAGAFAKAGNPFLTEDVIDLRLRAADYWLQPKRSTLRLFADSARFLLGEASPLSGQDPSEIDQKKDVEANGLLPFAKQEAPLKQIFILGTDHSAPLSIRSLSMQEALGNLLPHAFILDVEDKPRLQGHFARLADLSQDVPCFALDFTRDYSELPNVVSAVIQNR